MRLSSKAHGSQLGWFNCLLIFISEQLKRSPISTSKGQSSQEYVCLEAIPLGALWPYILSEEQSTDLFHEELFVIARRRRNLSYPVLPMLFDLCQTQKLTTLVLAHALESIRNLPLAKALQRQAADRHLFFSFWGVVALKLSPLNPSDASALRSRSHTPI